MEESNPSPSENLQEPDLFSEPEDLHMDKVKEEHYTYL